MTRTARRSWKARLGLALAITLAGAFAGVPQRAAGQSQVQGTLIYVHRVDVRCADSGAQVDQQTAKFVRNLYDALVDEVQGTIRLRPGLAVKWAFAPDAKSIEFTLRPGVKFSDGAAMTAEDVKFSFERLIAVPHPMSGLLAGLDQIEIVNPSTVRFKLKSPDVYFVNKVAKFGIVNRKVAMAHQESNDMGAKWLCRNSAGAGAYYMAEWQPNQYAIFKRNTHYWRGWDGKHIDTIRWQIVPENATQIQLLERLEADMVSTPFINDLERLRNVRGLRTVVTPAMETHMFTLNMARAPISDVRVRRALTAAFDYDAQAVYVWKRLGTVPRGFLPTRMECFNASIPAYKQDLGRARELLQQAGASNVRLSMNFTQGREDLKQAAAIFQDTLRNLGVTLDVRETPWPSLFEQQRRAETAPHMATLIQSAFTADPTTMMESSFHSRNVEKPYNWSIFKNADYDRLIDEARGTLDKAKRCEMLGRAQKIIVDEAPAIFFASPPRLETMRTRVKGYVPHPIDYFWSVKWYQLWLEE